MILLNWRSLLTPPTTRLKHNYCVKYVQIIDAQVVQYYIIIISFVFIETISDKCQSHSTPSIGGRSLLTLPNTTQGLNYH